jgi:hypothetical protein
LILMTGRAAQYRGVRHRRRHPDRRVSDSGVVRLTEAVNDQNGSFIINDQDGGAVIGNMTATFDLKLVRARLCRRMDSVSAGPATCRTRSLIRRKKAPGRD